MSHYIDCQYWSACDNRDGGCCSNDAVHFKRPSLGVCRRCDHRMSAQAGSNPTPSKLRQTHNLARAALHASKSIAKTTLGIDRATDEQIEARLNVCRQCPGDHAVYKHGKLHTCGPMVESMRQAGKGTCGCILNKKARDLKENCPFGYWPKLR